MKTIKTWSHSWNVGDRLSSISRKKGTDHNIVWKSFASKKSKDTIGIVYMYNLLWDTMYEYEFFTVLMLLHDVTLKDPYLHVVKGPIYTWENLETRTTEEEKHM